MSDKVTAVRYVAKCYGSGSFAFSNAESSILRSLRNEALPLFIGEYKHDAMTCIVREYADGQPLDVYAQQHELTKEQVRRIGLQLCDIMTYLHTHEPPVIHRDIKPQNIIIDGADRIKLIDFDISRTYDKTSSKDTQYLGTQEYAPPEQFGFSQTDSRSDIYATGVLLCYLLTGSTDLPEALPKISDRYLARVIKKCTAFAPSQRYKNAEAVKQALRNAAPKVRAWKTAAIIAGAAIVAAALIVGGIHIYRAATHSVFEDEGHVSALVLDEAQVADAANYLNGKYSTEVFTTSEETSSIGYIREIMIQAYGMDEAYVYSKDKGGDIPAEVEGQFYPWNFEDEQAADQSLACYSVVKMFWPEEIAPENYTKLKDDNGVYPGVRLAEQFCAEHGILDGVGRVYDLRDCEVTLIFANAERVREQLG